MQLFIKNFGIIICCIYFYIKLLHLNIPKKNRLLISIFTILLTLFSTFTDSYYAYITMPTIIFLIAIFLSYELAISLSTSITASTISFAFSYIIFAFSAIISSTFTLLFPKNTNHIIFQLIGLLFQLTLMPISFCFKRTKNGMPFLQKQFYSIPGALISIAIIFFAILLNTSTQNILYLIPVFFLLISAILIYLYWKNNLTKTYLDKLNERNLTDLNNVLFEKLEYISQLEQENKHLAEIIHKDNKLIPAMELAVKTYLSTSENKETDTLATGQQLLEELSILSEERKGILIHQDRECQKLASTKIMSTDNLLTYMQQRALEYDITFNVSISCDIPYLIEQIIEEKTLNILLADLLENAIIATRHNKGHHILLSIGIVSNAYSINIFDSGIPFTKEVLAKWGLEQITTHQDDSGSGIGLMTTYEIIKKKNASFIINEFSSDGGLYTKEVSVLFNNLNQYTLHTSRREEDIAYLNQRTDLLIIPK